LTIFTIISGGFGFILTTAFFENVAFKRLSEYWVMTITLGSISFVLTIVGMSALNIPINKFNLSVVLLSVLGLCFLRIVTTKWKVGLRFDNFKRSDLGESLLLAFLLLCLLIVRSVQMKEVIVPNWFDGLVHSSLLQKFIAKEIIPIDRIYHTGFHAYALVVYHLRGMTIPQAVLLLGQWLSVICGIAFYSFVRRFTRHVWVAYLSALAYSLILFFPSHLVSWSRFPFLMGLTLLPPTILTSVDWLNNHEGNYFLSLIFIGSLFVSHYGSFFIWFSFILVHLIYKIYLVYSRQNSIALGKPILRRSFFLFAPMVLFIFPKAINLWGRQDIVEKMLSSVHTIETQNVLNLILDNNYLFVLIWVFVSVISFIKGKRIFSILVVWPFTVLFLTWMQYYFLGISVTSFANSLIFLSMPLAISFGFLLFRLLLSISKFFPNWLVHQTNPLNKGILGFLTIIAIIPGILTNFEIVDSETIVFSEEDRLAMEWISNNVPPDSIFLIRSTLWGDSTFMPSDGGGWINLLTGRQTVYPQAIGELYDICAYARERDAKFIYFGENSGEYQFDLRLSDLDEKSYRTVYETKNIKIVYLIC
jgi:hypothetical protein